LCPPPTLYTLSLASSRILCAMQRYPFGKTGFEVSRLGFGGAPVGRLGVPEAQVHRLLLEALDAGVNLIDTAACYDVSEQLIGQAIGKRRDEYVLMSKCGHRAGDAAGEPFSPELITQSVDQSLRRLDTDVIDVMLLHSCGKDVLEQGEALSALERARDAGKVRCIGYAGDNDAAAYAATLGPVEVIELSVNIVDQHNIDAVLPKCQERGLGVIAKRPIANAAWKPTDELPSVFRDYIRPYADRLKAMGVTPNDLGFRGYADIEWPEIALRFALSVPGVHSAIVGTTSTVNLHANIAAAKKRALPEDVLAQLRESFTAAQSAAGETWHART